MKVVLQREGKGKGREGDMTVALMYDQYHLLT